MNDFRILRFDAVIGVVFIAYPFFVRDINIFKYLYQKFRFGGKSSRPTLNNLETFGSKTTRYAWFFIGTVIQESSIKKNIFGFILNQIMKSDNPSNDVTRSVAVQYPGTGSSSIFNMIWKPILQGVKGTVGFK